MHNVASVCEFPSVLQVQLLHQWRVVPAVAVLVHVHESAFVVCQHFAAQVVAEVQVANGVGFGFQVAVGVEVEQQAWLVFGLEVVHIDLSGDALRAVFHARGAFAHGYAFHPCARHVSQRIGGGGALCGGHVLQQELYVLSAQAEQFYLSCTDGGVAVVYVDRGVGDKAFAQVAAGGPEQFVLAYLHAVCGTAHARNAVGFALLYAHLLQRAVAGGVGLCADVGGCQP